MGQADVLGMAISVIKFFSGDRRIDESKGLSDAIGSLKQ